MQFIGQMKERIFNKSKIHVLVSGWWDSGLYIVRKISGYKFSTTGTTVNVKHVEEFDLRITAVLRILTFSSPRMPEQGDR
jgi:hypothetical protein